MNADIVVKGAHARVEYATGDNGRAFAKTWLESQPREKQRSFGVLFQRLADHGAIRNESQFRKLNERVWEFKRKGDRLACFRMGNRYLLTHHFVKSGRKDIEAEIERADRIGHEHIARDAKRGER